MKEQSETVGNFSIKVMIPGNTPDVDYAGYIPVVSAWTYLYQDVMKSRTTEKIQSYFDKGHSVLLTDGMSDALLAHAAIKWVSTSNQILEIGTVVVNPDFKGKRLGLKATSLVIELAKEKYPTYQLFAFCNSESLGLFKKLGWIEAKIIDLPLEVWNGCATCSNKQKAIDAGKLCCDTVVILPKQI